MAVSESVRTSILGMCQLPLKRFARYSVELAAREEPELRRLLLLAPQEVYDYPDVQRVGREALGSRVEQPAYFAFGGCQVASGGGIRHAREGAVGQSLEGSAFGVRKQRVEHGALHLAAAGHEELARQRVDLATTELERREEVSGVDLALEVTHQFGRRPRVLESLQPGRVVGLVERKLHREQVRVVLVLPRGPEERSGQFGAAEGEDLGGAGHVGG